MVENVKHYLQYLLLIRLYSLAYHQVNATSGHKSPIACIPPRRLRILEIATLHCVPLVMTLLCAAQRPGFTEFPDTCHAGNNDKGSRKTRAHCDKTPKHPVRISILYFSSESLLHLRQYPNISSLWLVMLKPNRSSSALAYSWKGHSVTGMIFLHLTHTR